MAITDSPAFQISDEVTVTFPGIHRGKCGVVVDITDHKGDFVFRYRVRFYDGETAAFFEFELQREATSKNA